VEIVKGYVGNMRQISFGRTQVLNTVAVGSLFWKMLGFLDFALEVTRFECWPLPSFSMFGFSSSKTTENAVDKGS